MKYVQNISKYTHEVKQSKFIALLTPYNQYTQLLEKLKAEHPKARHFVTAYRYINKYDQIVEHSSDDGEPKGTSGKPSLMVLQGEGIINAAVIIIRYFGGTKLGTGGLVRAYSDTVNFVIASSELVKYEKEIECKMIVEYGDMRFVDYECEAFDITVVEKIYDISTVYAIKASEKNMKLFLEKIARLVTIQD